MSIIEDILIPFKIPEKDKQFIEKINGNINNLYEIPEQETINMINDYFKLDIPNNYFYKNKLTDIIYGPKFKNDYIPNKGYIDIDINNAYEKYYNDNPLGVMYAIELYKDHIYSLPMSKNVYKNLKFINDN